MRLTPRAAMLQERLDNICIEIESLFEPEHFNPSTAKCAFTVAAPDYLAFLIMDSLLERLAREAPDIKIHFIDVPYRELSEQMEDGKIDLLVCANFGHWQTFNVEYLFRERYVAVFADNHPLASRNHVSMDEIESYPNTVVRYAGFQAHSHRWVSGLKVIDQISQISSMSQFDGLLMATRSPNITRAPAALAVRLRNLLPIHTAELNNEEAEFDTSMFWTPVTDRSIGHRWLRSLVRDTLGPYDALLGNRDRRVACPT